MNAVDKLPRMHRHSVVCRLSFSLWLWLLLVVVVMLLLLVLLETQLSCPCFFLVQKGYQGALAHFKVRWRHHHHHHLQNHHNQKHHQQRNIINNNNNNEFTPGSAWDARSEIHKSVLRAIAYTWMCMRLCIYVTFECSYVYVYVSKCDIYPYALYMYANVNMCVEQI